MPRSLFTLLRALTSPAERYRHARTLHGIRVGAALLASIALTSGIDIPHGVWASVSTLVVIGGLQHHGNIRQKAFERGVGTLLGAALGLAWVAQYALIGSVAVTYALLSVSAGICAYHAIGKGGYIALLTAITMFIVAGHGDDSIQIGLWRTLNVLIGISIAVAFSFALPLNATYAWRYGVAASLRDCARLLKALLGGAPADTAAPPDAFAELSKRLVALRALMPSVAKETGAAVQALEDIQRAHRTLICALEMMGSAARPTGNAGGTADFMRIGRDVRGTLLRAARDVRAGHPHRAAVAADAAPSTSTSAEPPASLPAALHGPYWLLEQIARQADHLGRLLGRPVRAV